MKLIRITANHFCAGVVLDKGEVIHSPPILKYMRGWRRDRILNYCDKKGWRAEVVVI